MALPCTLFAPPATPPAWWAQRGATNTNPADDFAVASIGQLKHFAARARDELNAQLPGGAGTAINNLVDGWLQACSLPTDLNVAKVGQLKHVGAILLRSAQAGRVCTWLSLGRRCRRCSGGESRSAIIKHVFSFDFERDSDGDGLPDFFERSWNLNPSDPNDADAWLIGNGIKARDLYLGFLAGNPNLPPSSDGGDGANATPQWEGRPRLALTQTQNGSTTVLSWHGPVQNLTNITIERQITYNHWIPVATVPASDGTFTYTVPAPDEVAQQAALDGTGPALNEPPNHRLAGAGVSNESVSQVRLIKRSSSVTRYQPGFPEYMPSGAPPKYYKRKSYNVVTSGWFGNWSWDNIIDTNQRTSSVANGTITRFWGENTLITNPLQ